MSPLDANHAVWQAAADLRARGEGFVLALVLDVAGHTPQVVGARMLVRSDGTAVGTVGGGALERDVLERAPEILAGGRAARVTFKLKAELGMCCGGRMEVWMEPVPATPRLLLCGAGHVGKATAELATAVGLRVEVLDHRPEWNTAERFSVTRHTGEPVATLTALASEGDLVVITTHDHDLDKRLVDAALRTEASYVGMIGSHRKASSTRRFLALAGHAEAAIERVHMPIGLDIFAETPEEIGLAIVAELVRHRREPASRKTTRGAAVGSRRDEEPA